MRHLMEYLVLLQLLKYMNFHILELVKHLLYLQLEIINWKLGELNDDQVRMLQEGWEATLMVKFILIKMMSFMFVCDDNENLILVVQCQEDSMEVVHDKLKLDIFMEEEGDLQIFV